MSEIRFTLPSSNLLPGALAALAAAALLLPTDAASQERGRLVSVEAGGDAAASSVELVGDRPLSFTTLKLQAPPRVVVDFADTEVAGAAAEVEVSDGTVRRVATAAAGQKTARVVIELVAEAEFDIRAHGNRVEVRIPRIAPLVAAGERSAQPGAAPAAESETEKRASLPTEDPVGSGAKPPSTEPARPLTPAEKAAADKREKAAAAVQAARDRRAAAAEKVAAAQRAKVEKAAAAKQAALDRRLAAAEKAAAGQRAKAEKAAAARERRLAAEKLAEDNRAAQAARSRSAARPQRTLAVAGSRHSITGIGFRPSGAGQVIVRSDHPLEYGVSGDASAVVLHLPGASIPLANNRLPLDTRIFNGPVQRVVPLAVEGGTDLRIELQAPADYQLEQSGSVLTVTFSTPR